MANSFLARAVQAAELRVSRASRVVPLEDHQARASRWRDSPRLSDAISGEGVAVIAEVKRASPSRGYLAPIPDPAGLAQSYAEGGAAAVSVLTEPQWFGGSLEDLAVVVEATALPVLRKDFLISPYQVWEARGIGAAAVLLIVAALEPQQLVHLLRTCGDASVDALIEIHDAAEVSTALAAYEEAAVELPLIIGVNARDLATLDVDPGQFADVRDKLPPEAIAVAESGVAGAEDVRRLADLGADAVLVGEHVATALDPRAAVAQLVAAGRTS